MSANREVISTNNAPAAIGPYSQAIRYGDLVFCSGQIALDPSTGQIVGTGDVTAQTERVLDNLDGLLAAAGSSFAHIVKTTIFLASMDDFATVNEIYGRRFADAPPARSTVEVSRLPKDVLIEIDVIAAVATDGHAG